MTANAIEIIKERIALLKERRKNLFTDVERVAEDIAIFELELVLSKLEPTGEPIG